jgi:hypothetical protein
MSLIIDVVDESDIMRASDRLVDRIRFNQQSKIYFFETISLIITISILCNIIAEVIMNYYIWGISAELSGQFKTIFVISVALLIILGSITLAYRRRFFKGATMTHIFYGYKVKSNKENDPKEMAEAIWQKINPISNWEMPRASYFSWVGNRLISFFFKGSDVIKKWDTTQFTKHDLSDSFENVGKIYTVSFSGEYYYARAFSSNQQVKRCKSQDMIQTRNTHFCNLTNCQIQSTMHVTDINSNLYGVTLNLNIKLLKTSSYSDELIQDISVLLRHYIRNLRKTLATITI